MKGISRTLWAAAAVATGVLFGAALWMGELNQDEGWYLYGARLVSRGHHPYLDFASTQGPVISYVYAAAQPLVQRWGVAGGRLFTGLLGLAAIAGCGWLAARTAALERSGSRAGAALMAVTLAGVNAYQAQFFTLVKTYALAACWLVFGFVALSRAWGRRGHLAAGGAGMLMGLAAATRSSAAVVIPVVCAALVLDGRRTGTGIGWRRAACFAVGAGLCLAAVFGPFVLRAPQAVRFALLDYHGGRDAGGTVRLLAYKAGFVSRTVQAYLAAVVCLLGVVLCRRTIPRIPAGGTLAWTLWASVAAMTLAHLAAPFPYDDYQVMVYPLLAAALGAGLERFAAAFRAAERARGALLLGVFLVSSAAAFSSPVLQGWFVDRRDRIWWPLKTETPLAELRRVGSWLAERVPADRVLLTQDTYLAVEAGRDVPIGMALGPFSYFPGWSDERADACRVLSRSRMKALLRESDAPVAAFSGWSLSIAAPSITELPEAEQQALWNLVVERYRPLHDVPRFGHAQTTLRILERR